MRDNGYSAGSLLLSFLLGGIVGAGLAILVAPQSGGETRRKIRDYADNVKEKTSEYAHGVQDKITSTVEEGKHLYEEKKSLVKSAVDAGKEAYEREKEKGTKEPNA